MLELSTTTTKNLQNKMLGLIPSANHKYYLPLREEIRILKGMTASWTRNKHVERRARGNPSFQKGVCQWTLRQFKNDPVRK